MKPRAQKKLYALALLVCAWLLLPDEALAQGYRVRVYNPGVYGRTRQSTSDRAAARSAVRRKKARRNAAAPGRPRRAPAP